MDETRRHELFPVVYHLHRVLTSPALTPDHLRVLTADLLHLQLFLGKCSPANPLLLLHPGHPPLTPTTAAYLTLVRGHLDYLQGLFRALLAAHDAYAALACSNEPFKKTRRRLPPQAEHELAAWLAANHKHPYMPDWKVEEAGRRFNVEEDQVRIFLTNSRRKMKEGGVRRRH